MEETKIQCKGECCSVYGMNFIACIVKTFNIKGLCIEDIMSQCHYMDGKEHTNLTNKERRFVLYWWFATNVYLICGSRNRCKLPICLINGIRKEYPEADNNYVGHKDY